MDGGFERCLHQMGYDLSSHCGGIMVMKRTKVYDTSFTIAHY